MTALELRYTWRTSEHGIVEVDRGRGFESLSLPNSDASTDRVLALVPDVLGPAAAAYGMPLPWLCAIAYVESGGRPKAIAPDGGRGLMQIQPSNFGWLGLTDETALDPKENVRAACELLRAIDARSMELPVVASRYNAGGPKGGGPWPSERSPWGMRETPGHIERVVRAHTWFVLSLGAGAESGEGAFSGGLGQGEGPKPPARSSGDVLAVVAIGAVLVWGWG